MRPSTEHTSGVDRVVAGGDDDHDLHFLQQRVRAEFVEMPGLIVTVTQAARLFAVDVPRCADVLDALVARGILVTDGRAFTRADAGARCA